MKLFKIISGRRYRRFVSYIENFRVAIKNSNLDPLAREEIEAEILTIQNIIR